MSFLQEYRNRPRRVVFYGRVSTEHEAQVSALDNQMDWYQELAAKNPNWEVVGQYVDEGITGTQATKRPSFMQMIEDAQSGKFDLIVTREVCRFARNTMDTLFYTRKLSKLGVEVYFAADSIWTMDNDGELWLTIMATMAQEESRKISERVRAGIQMSREKGVLYGNGNILGYDLDKIHKTYIINEEQAETVRMIFEQYATGDGLGKVAKALIAKGRKDGGGRLKWDSSKITRILRNPTYMGYCVYNRTQTTDLAAWQKLCGLGIREWIEEKKCTGAIGRIGFSFHGDTAAFLELLNAYDWDFCQIQYNYLDEHTQAGRKGLEASAAQGIPVIIMEPLRGGRLITGLSAEAEKRVGESGRTAAGWGLRWLWDQPGVTVVLSGMNSLEMIQDNAAQADEAYPGCMTPEEHAFVAELRADLQASMRVGCTGCGYCQPCPAGVDIPGVFASYNRAATEGNHAKMQYLLTTGLRRKGTGASQCVGCGQCERHCPQHLPIRSLLKDAAKELEGPLYKTARLGVKVLKLW